MTKYRSADFLYNLAHDFVEHEFNGHSEIDEINDFLVANNGNIEDSHYFTIMIGHWIQIKGLSWT